MTFFENLTLIRKKTVYSVLYKKKTLCTVRAEALGMIVKDLATKKFLKEISGLLSDKSTDPQLVSRAMLLGHTYVERKKKFYRNRNINSINTNTKDFNYLVKASLLMDKHKVTPIAFIESQIEGLKFINEGNGGFPSLRQLATPSAEDRLIKFLYENGLSGDSKEIVKMKLSHSDKETPLMENPRFVDFYKKMQNDNASLKEAYFIHDCMLARKGHATRLVLDYISDREDNE